MKKRILSLSIAAMIGGVGLAGSASAAVFTPANPATGLAESANNTGNILFVPYFSTQSGNATLLNIVNTDRNNGKAVKVRFRGASNSDDLYDFQVLLSPGDVWTASVSQDATTGVSTLATSDATCTLPTSVNGLFLTNRVQNFATAAATANQTREGYIEILNMADIPRFGLLDQAVTVNGALSVPAANPLFTAIRHVNGVPPCSTTTAGAAAINLLTQDPVAYSANAAYQTGLVQAASNAATVSASSTAQGLGLTYPTGGLFADWTIINVANTTTFSGQATGVVPTGGNGNLVFFPQVSGNITNTFVSNAAGDAAAIGTNLDAVTADPVFRRTLVAYNQATVTGATNPNNTSAVNSGVVVVNPLSSTAATIANPVLAASYFDLPDLSTPYYGAVSTSSVAALNQSLALTQSLAVGTVSNEYLTSSAISGATDWVFSMPTRRYHTAYAYAYAGTTGNGQVYTDYTSSAANTPFAYFGPRNTTVSTSATTGLQICTRLSPGVTGWGREEQTLAVTNPGFVISPGTAAPTASLQLCGETSVLSFGGVASAVLGATVANTVFPAASLPAADGWATFATLGGTGYFSTSLPIVGYSAEKAVNGAVKAGVSGNFGLQFNHR
jgi:hypothetical protein